MLQVRHLILLLVASVALGVAARAADARDAAAVAAYRAGDLAAARAGFVAALDAEPRPAGPERARLLANLGNVAFREGAVLESVGWYTASLRLRPRHGDTWANLEHARRKAGLEPADRGDLRATVERLLGAFTPGEARWLALVGIAGLAAALLFEALRGGRIGRWTAAGGAGFALLLSSPSLHGAWTSRDAPALVVTEGSARVRSEPRADAAVVAEVPAGAEVEVTDALPGWVKIDAGEGNSGWVGQRDVFRLDR